ncbi:MAG TPA: hypothetical protein PLZ83_08425 [Dermatophilaceae bacterium]|nr:hypothetical protein [Dermatophilaceae bacterium]HPK89442.1 hypothetical protein [Dermatophilaceae bacterium]HQG11123.1 hypothetical protein [Dermatophilaceae bacterium]HQH90381.1 hypothetical protein [Dermatophilaceae bacterium]
MASVPTFTHGVRSTVGRSTPVELHSIIVFLVENLGSRLLCFIVGVDVRTIERWVSNRERNPRLEYEQRIRDTYQVFQTVLEVEASPTVRAWFMGMNPQLDDLSPAEAIRDGRSRDAMAAARAFVNAG